MTDDMTAYRVRCDCGNIEMSFETARDRQDDRDAPLPLSRAVIAKDKQPHMKL